MLLSEIIEYDIKDPLLNLIENTEKLKNFLEEKAKQLDKNKN